MTVLLSHSITTKQRTLNLQLTQGIPKSKFWEQYSRLWMNSSKSPFQAPSLLQSFTALADQQLFIVSGYVEEELQGVVFLQKKGNRYYFLSDLKNDFNSFVFEKTASPTFLKNFFVEFLALVKKAGWAMLLNNQPTWKSYWPIFQQALQASKLYSKILPYALCLVVKTENGNELYEKIHQSRELRYRVNRLVKQQSAVFEALEGDDDLDNWVTEFCKCHVKRWSDTKTPSKYADPEQRLFLKNCLQAWIDDKILVRFSVIVNEQRIGFVVGLRQENKLVHHTTTYNTDFRKYSPGKALTHYIAEWMRDQEMNALDFGYGDEKYKYEIANQQNQLARVFISRRLDLPLIAQAEMIATIKNYPKAYAFYLDRIKPLI